MTEHQFECENEKHSGDGVVRPYRVHDEWGEFSHTAHYCDPCAGELEEAGEDIRAEAIRWHTLSASLNGGP
jgi:hypothetical protein